MWVRGRQAPDPTDLLQVGAFDHDVRAAGPQLVLRVARQREGEAEVRDGDAVQQQLPAAAASSCCCCRVCSQGSLHALESRAQLRVEARDVQQVEPLAQDGPEAARRNKSYVSIAHEESTCGQA